MELRLDGLVSILSGLNLIIKTRFLGSPTLLRLHEGFRILLEIAPYISVENNAWSIMHIPRTCNEAVDILARLGDSGLSFIEYA